MDKFEFKQELLEHLPAVRRFAISLCRRPDLADDLMQETATRALSHQNSFDGANMAAWLFTICRNTYRSMWRNDDRHEEPLTEAIASRLVADVPSVDTAYDAKIDLQRTLVAVNGNLPLVLALLDDLSYGQMAAKFGMAEGTIKSRLSRTRTHARKILDRDLPAVPIHSKPRKYRPKKWVLSAAERSARIKAGRAKAKAERIRLTTTLLDTKPRRSPFSQAME